MKLVKYGSKIISTGRNDTDNRPTNQKQMSKAMSNKPKGQAEGGGWSSKARENNDSDCRHEEIVKIRKPEVLCALANCALPPLGFHVDIPCHPTRRKENTITQT